MTLLLAYLLIGTGFAFGRITQVSFDAQSVGAVAAAAKAVVTWPLWVGR